MQLCQPKQNMPRTWAMFLHFIFKQLFPLHFVFVGSHHGEMKVKLSETQNKQGWSRKTFVSSTFVISTVATVNSSIRAFSICVQSRSELTQSCPWVSHLKVQQLRISQSSLKSALWNRLYNWSDRLFWCPFGLITTVRSLQSVCATQM